MAAAPGQPVPEVRTNAQLPLPAGPVVGQAAGRIIDESGLDWIPRTTCRERGS
jgi:hypothetical protein